MKTAEFFLSIRSSARAECLCEHCSPLREPRRAQGCQDAHWHTDLLLLRPAQQRSSRERRRLSRTEDKGGSLGRDTHSMNCVGFVTRSIDRPWHRVAGEFLGESSHVDRALPQFFCAYTPFKTYFLTETRLWKQNRN